MTRGEARTIVSLLTLLLLITAIMGVNTSWQAKRPALVGYGCENTTGPIYAQEEDHFPKCTAIEENR